MVPSKSLPIYLNVMHPVGYVVKAARNNKRKDKEV